MTRDNSCTTTDSTISEITQGGRFRSIRGRSAADGQSYYWSRITRIF
jgi:hypothetical protein